MEMTQLQKRKTRKELPDTLSGLLRLAVADARHVDKKMKTAELDMTVFESHNGNICIVCMGGAVMLRQYGRGFYPKLNTDDYYRMCAIDAMRRGTVPTSYTDQHFPGKVDKVDNILRPIRENFSWRLVRAPWRVYLKVANELERAGM